MFDIDRWNEVWNALAKNKKRSLLTAFGVFWGLFMLMVLAGAGRGLESGVDGLIGKVAKNSTFFWTGQTGEPYKGFRRGRRWYMESGDIQYLRNNLPDMENIVPMNFGGMPKLTRGTKNGTFSIVGHYPDFVNLAPFSVLKGRWINEMDIRERRKVCVIGERVEEVMFDPAEDPIGQHLKIWGVYYQVAGVIRPETEVNLVGRPEESIVIPFTTMQKTYNMGNRVNVFAIMANKGVPVSALEERAKGLIKTRHSIAPTDSQALNSFNMEDLFKQMSGLFLGIQILTWIVGVGTIIAGVIGVSNIMLVIVRERTREIGIQRALGATPRTIISQILLESLTLTIAAGYTGLMLGFGLLELINMLLESMAKKGSDTYFSNFRVSLPMALAALGILVVSGLFAGMIPASRAIRIKPIDAIREE